MTLGDLAVICIDPDCSKFNQREFVSGRSPIFNHCQKKSSERIIKILKKYDILNDCTIFTRLSLVNILVDCCYSVTAVKLLKKLEHEKEVSMNAI